MGAKLTAASIKRRSPEEITTLAREMLMGQKIVTNDPRVIRSAFFMIMAFVDMTDAASKTIGALIGDVSEAVRGRAMNGYPIFYSVAFLHRADLDAFDAEVNRMRVAMGLPPRED